MVADMWKKIQPLPDFFRVYPELFIGGFRGFFRGASLIRTQGRRALHVRTTGRRPENRGISAQEGRMREFDKFFKG